MVLIVQPTQRYLPCMHLQSSSNTRYFVYRVIMELIGSSYFIVEGVLVSHHCLLVKVVRWLYLLARCLELPKGNSTIIAKDTFQHAATANGICLLGDQARHVCSWSKALYICIFSRMWWRYLGLKRHIDKRWSSNSALTWSTTEGYDHECYLKIARLLVTLYYFKYVGYDMEWWPLLRGTHVVRSCEPCFHRGNRRHTHSIQGEARKLWQSLRSWGGWRKHHEHHLDRLRELHYIGVRAAGLCSVHDFQACNGSAYLIRSSNGLTKT